MYLNFPNYISKKFFHFVQIAPLPVILIQFYLIKCSFDPTKERRSVFHVGYSLLTFALVLEHFQELLDALVPGVQGLLLGVDPHL